MGVYGSAPDIALLIRATLANPPPSRSPQDQWIVNYQAANLFVVLYKPIFLEHSNMRFLIKGPSHQIFERVLVSICFFLLEAMAIDPVLACSMGDDALARANSVTTANYYWIASACLGGVIICIELSRKWMSAIMVLTFILIALHPAWLLPPNYYPDCSFQNVEASRADLLILVALVGYQLVRVLRRASVAGI